MSAAVDVLNRVAEPALDTDKRKHQIDENNNMELVRETKKIKVESEPSTTEIELKKEEINVIDSSDSESKIKENINTASENKQDSPINDENKSDSLQPSDMSTQPISTFREVCDKWSHEVESAFIGALRLILKNGTYKIKLLDKNYGRNELISIYIQYKTKEVRTKKQISSHIQVWKKAILSKMTNDVPLSELEKEVLRLIEHGVQQNEHTVKIFYSVFEEIVDPMSYRNDNIKISKSQSNLSLTNSHLHQNIQGQSNLSNFHNAAPHQYTQMQQQNNGYLYPRAHSISAVPDPSSLYRALPSSQMHAGNNVYLQHLQNTSYPHLNKLRVLSESNIYMPNSMPENTVNNNNIVANSQVHQSHSQNEFTNSYTTNAISADLHRNNSIASQSEDALSIDKNKVQYPKYHSYTNNVIPSQTNSNAYTSQYSSLKLPPVSTMPTYGANNYKKYQYSSGDNSQRSSLGQIQGNVSNTSTTLNQASGMGNGSVSNTLLHQQHNFNTNGLLSYQQSNITQEKPVIPRYSTKSLYTSNVGVPKAQHPMPMPEHVVPNLSAANPTSNSPLSMGISSQQNIPIQQRVNVGTPIRAQPLYLQMQKLSNEVNQPSQVDSQLPNEYIHYK
ncbi:hypothetical protein TPHA_0M01320 [Tetrapisispora phaffii CBS 4417]|uniref:TEA domain-containing protein n=1 Tax=Tetrapisispora phaffii (strain ATCC 24235 / CBS 4417 / NBRC 1672 / NRRL Y-8282 / UCD 70-5) TaxID=1071381 RepID=G8C0J2_TETPH|nr:hypothetical protein TPHA_0M01320 [Tetrapisispora phaffii CBS 4417]CCE65707.1 hypothetical protein TPHA_0M01320 [Tetrapisispora phaffii CBS 4417]